MPVRHRRDARLCGLQYLDAADADALQWRLRAREFAEEVVRPLGLALDRLPLAETVAPDSPLHEFLDQADTEGFTALPAASRDLEYLVLEEIATADAGLGGLLITARAAATSPGTLGCLYSPARPGGFRLERGAAGGLLSGSARMPVIGAAAATHAVIVSGAAGGSADQSLVVAALDRAGVRRAIVESQLGLRAGAAATLTFDGVVIDREDLIEHGDRSRPRIARALALDQLSVAITSVGIARAAYEGAARWSRERGADDSRRIAVMRAMLERARSVTRAAYAQPHGAGSPAARLRCEFARTLASQTATELARHALRITGPGSLGRDGVEYLDGSRFFPDKLVRDAHEHGFLLPRRPATERQRVIHQREQRSASWGL